MDSSWRSHTLYRAAIVAAGASVALAAAACSTSTSGTPQRGPARPVSSPASHASQPADPLSSAPASDSETAGSGSSSGEQGTPSAGAVAYLRLYQQLFDTRRPLVNDLNAAGAHKQLSAAVAALRKLRDAESTFNLAVRKVQLGPSATGDVNSMLTDSNTLIGMYDKANAASSFSQFSNAYIASFDIARQLDTDEVRVGSDVGVMTDHPAEHLAPNNLPQVIKPYTAHLFGSEGTSTINGGYKSGIYRMRIDQSSGSIFEDVMHPVNVYDTEVTSDMYLLGKSTTGYVSCRSSGVGTNAGQGYYFGVTSDGTWYIQRIDAPSGYVDYLASGTSKAIHTGTNARNSIVADCVGSYLTLFANSVAVFQVYDPVLTHGNVGVGAATPDGPGEVLVGNLTAAGNNG